MKNARRNLHINRETVMHLEPVQLAEVIGGRPIDSKGSPRGNTCEPAATQAPTCHVSI